MLLLNDLSPERFAAALAEAAGAGAAEARKLFSAIHGRHRRSLWRGEGVPRSARSAASGAPCSTRSSRGGRCRGS